MEDEKLSRLTAEEFYPKWAEANGFLGHFLYEDEWMQFAEAYAAHLRRHLDFLREDRKNDEDLLRRAAELLSDVKGINHAAKGWGDKRDQWLRDAGVEK